MAGNMIGRDIGRYHVVEQVGQGGMATVYKAFDTRLEREVALKIIRIDEIPASQHERLFKRFEREAKAQAKFSHPNIVAVHDYGEVEGSPYLVMDHVAGGTLKDKLKQPVDYRQAVKWLLPIANALGYAHVRGIVHRDVKPGNILFDENGRPLLTDFGIAKILETEDATLTGTGLGVGTPEYMSPEQWKGQAGAASDQYALGVVLYEMVTAQKPYTAETPAAVAIMQATEPIRRPAELVKNIPERLEKVLYKALAKEPEDRYANMAAFEAALEKVLSIAETVEYAAQVKAGNTPAQTNVGSEDETHDVLAAPPVVQKKQTGNKGTGKKMPAWVWVGLGTLLLLGLMIGAGNQLVKLGAGGTGPLAMLATATQTATATLTSTATMTPTLTKTATQTKTATATLTPTATMGVGSSKVNEKDGAVLVYVPVGEFTMGSNDGYNGSPEHTVYVDAYWMYKTEVTNGQYLQCIEAGVCGGDLNNYQEKRFPAIYIDWYEANDYCAWAGGRLPTEAEWEKAARGTDGRIYPWGNSEPTCGLAKYMGGCSGFISVDFVGSFPAGASPYGVLDMAGNVLEWVSDWYDEMYYSYSPDENPTGPVSGTTKVLRGGSWGDNVWSLRASNRYANEPVNSGHFSGFRCVIQE